MFFSNNKTPALLLLTLLQFFSSYAATDTLPATAPVTYHTEFKPEFKPEFHPVFTNTPTINTYVIIENIQKFTNHCCDKVRNTFTKENYDDLKNLIKKIAWEKRYSIAGYGLLGSYATINFLLFSDYSFLTDASLWSRWKPECSFEDLCALSAQQLEKELILSITQRHCNKQNPTDLATTLIRFINTLDYEIYRINRYIKTAATIKKCHLMPIFCTNDTKIENARRLLERAHFIRHIFMSWLAEFNIASK